VNAGYKFSSATFESGRQILIYASSSVNMFLFLNPFDDAVWLSVMATAVFVGIAVLFAEVRAHFCAGAHQGNVPCIACIQLNCLLRTHTCLCLSCAGAHPTHDSLSRANN
jgi:hypothetical protein